MTHAFADHSQLLDARPMAAKGGGTWDLAFERQAEIAAIVRENLDRLDIDALVQQSQRGIAPPWVKVEAWLPVAGQPGRQRATLEFVIDNASFNIHPTLVTARLSRGNRAIAVDRRPQFEDSDVAQWVRHALDRGPSPSNYTPVSDAVLHMICAFIPFVHGPHHNPLRRQFRSNIDGAGLLFMASLGLLVLSLISLAQPYAGFGALFGVLFGIAGLAGATTMSAQRKSLVAAAHQPEETPARLVGVDSWHAVVQGLGPDAEAMKQNLRRELVALSDDGVVVGEETFGYRTAYGYEERQRLFISKGQSVVHLHIYPFGHDAFVAWQSHLNWSKWTEQPPVSNRGIDNYRVEFRDVAKGTYIPSQLDLIDLNALADLVHRRLTDTLKRTLRERSIDQEIDFEILRGDREAALDAKRHDTQAAAGGGLFSRVSGIALQRVDRAETEIEKDSGPVVTARPAVPGRAGIAVLVLAVAAGLSYLFNTTGMLFTTTAWAINLTETYLYTYYPLIDVSLLVALVLGLRLSQLVTTRGAVFTALVGLVGAATADFLFNLGASNIFPDFDRFIAWAGESNANSAMGWGAYAVIWGIVISITLAIMVPAGRSLAVMLAALIVLVGSQVALSMAGGDPLVAMGLSDVPLAISFLWPYLLFCAVYVYLAARKAA